ncbi:MAG: hypothetical protein ACE5JA_00140 [bacterium]
MIDYLVQLVGALGVTDQKERKEIASDMEKAVTISDGEEREVLRNRLKTAISPYGRFETASGQSDKPMKALERAISSILLKEGLFFRSYAIVVVVHSKNVISQAEVNEINRTMRRLAGRFTNIMVKPMESSNVEGHEVRLFAIGLHEAGRVK